MLNKLLSDIEKDLSKEIELSFNYEDLAKRLYTFLMQEYLRSPQTRIKNHIENLKKTIPNKD